jgi:hypothetical protein
VVRRWWQCLLVGLLSLPLLPLPLWLLLLFSFSARHLCCCIVCFVATVRLLAVRLFVVCVRPRCWFTVEISALLLPLLLRWLPLSFPRIGIISAVFA